METLGKIKPIEESRLIYSFCKKELDSVFKSLYTKYDSITAVNSREVGIYKHVKKLLPCFDLLYEISSTSSIQSLKTMERMIVDNYAILFLLSSHSTEQEKNLRYYLYLLDAVKSRTNIINSFSTQIPDEIPQEIMSNAKSAKDADQETYNDIKELIKDVKLDSLVNENIIEQCNWKYKDGKKSNGRNCYSWVELYQIAKIPKRHAQVLQDYHSSYVHGLGISLMIGDDDNLLPIIKSTLDFCSVLQTMIIKIIMTSFFKETRDIELPESMSIFMNKNWDDWK
jgi:hypothetical protein